MHRQTSVKSRHSVSDSRGRLERPWLSQYPGLICIHFHTWWAAAGAAGRWRLTFAGVVSQNGAGPHLLPFDGLAGAGLRAGGPRGPVAEHAVPRARHLAGHGLRGRGGWAEVSVHRLSWRKKKKKTHYVAYLFLSWLFLFYATWFFYMLIHLSPKVSRLWIIQNLKP